MIKFLLIYGKKNRDCYTRLVQLKVLKGIIDELKLFQFVKMINKIKTVKEILKLSINDGVSKNENGNYIISF